MMWDEIVEEAIVVDGDQPVSKAIPLIKEGCLIVEHKKKYYGIVDDRVLRRNIRAYSFSDRTKIKSIAEKAPVLDGSESIPKIASLFLSTDLKDLPFEKNGKITKVVSLKKFLNFLLQKEKDALQSFKVLHLASTPPITIDSSSTVAEAIKKMRENKINRLLVVNGREYGLITSFDLAKRLTINKSRMDASLIKQRESTLNSKVEQFMEKNLITIDSSKSAFDAANTMLSNNISSLVVTQGSVPIGFITIRDILEGIFVRPPSSKVEIVSHEPRVLSSKEEIREKLNKILENFEDIKSAVLRIKKGRLYELNLVLFLEGGKKYITEKDYKLDHALYKIERSLKRVLSDKVKAEPKRHRKLQSSIELLVTIGFGLGVLLPFLLIAYSQATTSFTSLVTAQAYATAQKIVTTANIIGSQGEPAKQTIQVFIPQNIKAIYIGSKTQTPGVGPFLDFQIQGVGGVSDIVVYSQVNISGTIRYMGSGSYLVTLTAFNSCPLNPSLSCVFINSSV